MISFEQFKDFRARLTMYVMKNEREQLHLSLGSPQSVGHLLDHALASFEDDLEIPSFTWKIHFKAQSLRQIDDDTRILELLGSAFRGDGRFDVRSTTDGDDALRLCAEDLPALVVLDISLPGRGGYSVCRTIKLHPDWGDVQVVMLSGLAYQAEWETWRKMGADDFVVKPFVVDDLVSLVAARLRLDAGQ